MFHERHASITVPFSVEHWMLCGCEGEGVCEKMCVRVCV